MYSGKSLAAALCFGAEAVWVGTRFVAAKEAGAPKGHQDAVVTAGFDDTIRTIIFTGRPLRVRKNPFILEWEKKQDEIKKLTDQGILPAEFDLDEREKAGTIDEETEMNARPYLMGQVAAVIHEVQPAKQIMEEMVAGAIKEMNRVNGLISGQARL